MKDGAAELVWRPEHALGSLVPASCTAGHVAEFGPGQVIGDHGWDIGRGGKGGKKETRRPRARKDIINGGNSTRCEHGTKRPGQEEMVANGALVKVEMIIYLMRRSVESLMDQEGRKLVC